jgi:hypothetical protein
MTALAWLVAFWLLVSACLVVVGFGALVFWVLGVE